METATVAADLGHPSLAAMLIFAAFIALSLGVTFWAAKRTRSADDFYAAGGKVTALQNGFALAGDFLAAAGFLGIAGYISLTGFDGMAFSLLATVGFPMLAFLLAEPLRKLGKYTFTDVVAYRTGSATIRVVSASCGLVVVVAYLIMQMVAGGNLLQLLFGIPYGAGVAIIGGIMLLYVVLGGMVAATWIQIIKAVLMFGAAVAMVCLVLARFHGNPLELLDAASTMRGFGVLGPGPLMSDPLQAISIVIGVFGIASLPHVLIRFYTVPDVRVARRSLLYAVLFIGTFQLCIVMLGFGAMVLVGGDAIRSVDAGGNMAIPLLAQRLGGNLLLAFVTSVSFATILAVVSGLVIAGSVAISHDIWTHAIRKGRTSSAEQVRVARFATVALCIVAILAGLLFKGQNIGWLVSLGSGLSASTIFPALFLSIYWSKLTAAGASTGMLTGLVVNLVLIYLSPLVQIDMLHHASAIVSLRNPAIVAVPLAFAATLLVSMATYREDGPLRYAAMQRQMLTGASDA